MDISKFVMVLTVRGPSVHLTDCWEWLARYANFGDRQALKQDICHTYGDGSHTFKARVVLGKHSIIGTQSCALVAFTDMT